MSTPNKNIEIKIKIASRDQIDRIVPKLVPKAVLIPIILFVHRNRYLRH